MTNPFFKNTGPYEINDLLELISIKNQLFSDEKINDIKDLSSSRKGDITFLHSKKYGELAKSINASFCVTSENLKSLLPNTCKPIISDKILLDVAKITKKFYPNSVTDDFDDNVELNLFNIGLLRYLIYFGTVLFTHHFLFFLLEQFSFVNFFALVFKSLINSIIALVLIAFLQYMFISKK